MCLRRFTQILHSKDRPRGRFGWGAALGAGLLFKTGGGGRWAGLGLDLPMVQRLLQRSEVSEGFQSKFSGNAPGRPTFLESLGVVMRRIGGWGVF